VSEAAIETDSGRPPRPSRLRFGAWRNRLVASRRFQAWASRFLLTRGIAKREGEALFDLVAGFVHSQVLHALVELRILHMLLDAPATVREVAGWTNLDPRRAEVLLRAGVALGLLSLRRDGRFALSRRGAALLGVPGLEAMILHHRAFYRDLQDPVGFFRDGSDTELARFWPYVFGKAAEIEPEVARTYSDLMADSQALVAEETLRTVRFDGIPRLMDVGGGSGAFLAAVAIAHPTLRGMLFDLPEVVPAAEERFRRSGLSDRIAVVGGSFRDEALPRGADAISLVRVLYDHADDTVALLLRRAREALPPGGRLIVSEPMTGGDSPSRPGDTYFALYTMAMGTGRTRSTAEIARHLRDAGFADVTERRASRPFVTSVVEARHPLEKDVSK
jgi:demethylspheroidene O-methyltransferase